MWPRRLATAIYGNFPNFGAKVMGKYRLIHNEAVPWTPVKKRVEDSLVALVTSAGVHRQEDHPFNLSDPMGDSSCRVIPADVPISSLIVTHHHYDHRDADRDINVVFPLARLRELADRGKIAGSAPNHYSFMGSLPEPTRLEQESAPALAERLKAEGADICLLTPA